ncbi:MAG: ATP-binding protein [Gammaproteobacteria bacterium]|nr:ATP-binding protein [Gammaproteobacteria bacterium]
MTTKPTTIILSGFSLVIILIMVLLAISLYQLKITHTTLNDSIKHEAEQTSLANDLQHITYARSETLIKIMHANDVFVQDQLIQDFYTLGENFLKRRNQLIASNLDREELALINQHRGNANQISLFQRQVIELTLQKNSEQAHHLFSTKAFPLQHANTKLLNKIVTLQNFEIKQDIDKLTSRLDSLFIILLTTGSIVIAICILIAYFIYQRLTRNITELQNAHQALTDSISTTQNIEHALDEHAIVSITDTSGNITYVNEKFCHISQYSAQELLGSNHRLINSDYHNRAFFRSMMTTISSGETWQGEIRNQKKDGSYYWVATTIVPFLDKNDTPYQYIAIRTDISHLKNTENQLAISLQQLAAESAKALETTALKSAIISTMTHELKTPLNSILGFSQLLLLENETLSDMQTDNITNIIESGKDLLYNIENIMLYSKLKSNTISTQQSLIDLDLLLQSIIDEIHSQEFSSLVLPVLETSNSLETSSDMPLLRKAFFYVIDNAVKFTAQGKISIHVSSLQAGTMLPGRLEAAAGNFILITIKDTGIGIPDDKLKIIFDEFRQVEEKDNRQFEGFGIGLSLAKSIISLLNGDIWLTSSVNIGTTVYITLPQNND